MTDRRPEPAAVGSAITAAFPVVMFALVALGVFDLDSEQQAATAAAIAALVTVFTAAMGWWHTRQRVTPLSSPRDDRGVPMAPIDLDPPPTP